MMPLVPSKEDIWYGTARLTGKYSLLNQVSSESLTDWI